MKTITGSIVALVTPFHPDGSVDPALASLAPRLTRQFSQFTAFRQFSQRSIPLAVGAPQRVTLPGDQVATIELRSAQNGELEIRVSIPGGGTTVRTRGGMFFVGGAPAPGGTVILAIQT